MNRKKSHNIVKPYLNDEEYEERRGKKRDDNKYSENRHHILARSLGGTNSPNNIKKLYEPIHSALHRVLGNGDLKTQIKRLMKISETATTRELQSDMEKILKENDIRYRYKEDIFYTGHYK